MSKAFIIGIVVVVIAAAAAFGGYLYGTNVATAQAAAAQQNFFRSRGIGNGGAQGTQGQNGQGNGQGNFNPNNFANGQVKSISGNTIQISTARAVVTVTVTDQTQIRKAVNGTISDIQPGQRITVQGETNPDGTLTASAIQIGLGVGGGRQGQGGQGEGGQGQATPTP